MAEYQPGVCNIGAQQRRARRLSGIGSFAIAIVLVLAVALDALPTGVLWATTPFVFGGWIGLVQDYYGFCVAFGALARYDLGGTAGSVVEAEAVAADRRRAVRILAVTAVLTAVTTVPVVLLGRAI
jgi:hypothetical protein